MTFIAKITLNRYLQCLIYFLIASIWIIIIFEITDVKLYGTEYTDITYQQKESTASSINIENRSKHADTQFIESVDDEPYQTEKKQRGNYWVLYNFVRATVVIEPHTSITYTTHSDYTYLNNLVPLVKRWKGPISIAVFAPGNDFEQTLQSIHYLKDCTTSRINEFVTFHIYFNIDHVPKEIPTPEKTFIEKFDCNKKPNHLNDNVTNQTYKARKGLIYPVNVGRNIARESAHTHFVLASDIELYPSPGLIPKFLDMIASNRTLTSKKLKIFVLNIFEVESKHPVPKTKTELRRMIIKKTAIPFHMHMCLKCHMFPKIKQWILAKETEGLGVFHIAKRTGKYKYWEPIFIGTNLDPFYDERLSWEGKSDKMTQGYVLCVLDYDYMMLDNAFLVHKPGIKIFKMENARIKDAIKTKKMLDNVVREEYKTIYGAKDGCAL